MKFKLDKQLIRAIEQTGAIPWGSLVTFHNKMVYIYIRQCAPVQRRVTKRNIELVAQEGVHKKVYKIKSMKDGVRSKSTKKVLYFIFFFFFQLLEFYVHNNRNRSDFKEEGKRNGRITS